MAEINPFRFSSEFYDDETGLVYYNYRYYNPNLGRWTKRDSIEEDGGINEYLFNNNNSMYFYDELGNQPIDLKNAVKRIIKNYQLNENLRNNVPTDKIVDEWSDEEVKYGSVRAILEQIVRTKVMQQFVAGRTSFTLPEFSHTLFMIPHPAGKITISAAVNLSGCPCTDGNKRKINCSANIVPKAEALVGVGIMGNENRRLIPKKKRSSKGGPLYRYRKTKGDQKGGVYAPTPSPDSYEAQLGRDKNIDECPTERNSGTSTVEIGAKAQAFGYVDVYGSMTFAPAEDIAFSYGTRVGTGIGVGAGAYIAVSGNLGINYVIEIP